MSRVYSDYPWRVFVTTLASGVITDLDCRGTDRQFLFTLNGPAYHTGQAASDDREINRPYPNADDPAYLTNNRRLLYALRRELGASPPYVCRFGGIVDTLEDQGADAPTTRYTAYDPWHLMYSRPARYPPGAVNGAGDPIGGLLINEAGWTYPKNTRASTIAVDMLLETEAEDGESHIDYITNPGLIEDTTPLGAPFTIEQAQSVGDVWDALVATGTIDILLDPIYDPIARPGKLCELRIAQFASSIRYNTVLGWDTGSHSLLGMTRTVDRLANKIRFLSGAAKIAVTQSDAGSVAANGPYWLQQAIGGSTHQALADFYALIELRMRRNGARTITFSPISDRLDYVPLKDYALGDWVPVWASRNLREPIGIDYDAYDPTDPGASGFQRVYGIPITLDDNSVESVEGLITSQDSPLG